MGTAETGQGTTRPRWVQSGPLEKNLSDGAGGEPYGHSTSPAQTKSDKTIWTSATSKDQGVGRSCRLNRRGGFRSRQMEKRKKKKKKISNGPEKQTDLLGKPKTHDITRIKEQGVGVSTFLRQSH